jgi:tetratricopeptide (TPR) repeat protein
LDRNEEALRHFDIALELDPVSPIILWHSTWALGALGRSEEALTRLRKIIEIDPAFPIAYASVATLSACDYGRADMAIPWNEKAASLDPGNPLYATGVAEFYLQLGDDAEANRWLQRALQHGSRFSWAHELAAVIYLYRGDHAGFERHARTAESISGAFKLLADADLRRGDAAAARARYAKAFPDLLAANPPEIDELELAVTAKNLAYVLQHTREEERARLLLDRSEAFFRRSSPKDWTGHEIHYIALHALRGDSAKALARLRDSKMGIMCEKFPTGWRYYRDFEPTLASIRGEPEFKAAFARIEAEMAAQRARLAARPKDAPLKFEEVEKLVAAGASADQT